MTIIYSSIDSDNSKIQTEEANHIGFTSKSPNVTGHYSKAMLSGNLLFCSGQIGLHSDTMELVSGGIEEEAKQAFRNISNLLREYSSGLKDVIKATIYLKNIEDIEIVDNIYKNYFVLKPARTIIGVSGLPKNALIEIEVIAKKQATSTGF